MALSRTLLTAGGDTTNQNVFVTGSITRAANRLVLVMVHYDPSGSGVVPTVTGAGLTYDLIARNIVNPASTRTVCVFRGMDSVGGSGTITIDAGALQDGCIWHVFEYDGVDTSGVNGSGAIASVLDDQGVESSLLDPNVPLPNAAAAGNEWICILGQSNAAVVTPGTGWTQISNQEITTPNQRATVQTTTTETVVHATVANTINWFVAGVEVKASGTVEHSAVLPMAAVGGMSVAGSLSGTAVLAAAAVASATIGAVRSQFATLPVSAVPALAIAAVRSQLAVLTAAALSSLAIGPLVQPTATLSMTASGLLVVSGSQNSTAVLAVRGTPALTVGAVRTQNAVLAVAGLSAATIGTLRTAFSVLIVAGQSTFTPNTGAAATLAVSGVSSLTIATRQSFLRILVMVGQGSLLIGAVLIGDIHPHRKVRAAVLDSGVRLAVLFEMGGNVVILSDEYLATLTRDL